MKRTSIIWTIEKEKLKEFVDSSDAVYMVLEKLGLKKTSAGSFRVLKQRLAIDNIDITKLNCRAKQKKIKRILEIASKKKKSVEELFVKSKNSNRSLIKRRIIQENLIPYVCKDCGLSNIWNSKKLSLQLEHINGDGDDNTLENLCFLCPNCHSQTSTWCSKNKKH